MLRSVVGSALRIAVTSVRHLPKTEFVKQRNFGSLTDTSSKLALWKPFLCSTESQRSSLIAVTPTSLVSFNPVRSVTKFSLNSGKRKSVKAVIRRFKRLNWGIWIRTHAGRQKKLFKKSPALRRRLRQHIFTNATQSWLLDKMVTSFWRRPKYYIDDPYTPYHTRDEYFATKGKTFRV